jgi:hypothetical protein
LVAQQSTSDHVFHVVDGQVQGDEVGVAIMEQVATTAQAETTYNYDDDLEEMTHLFIDL